jgi:hypothetical protein
MKFPAEKSDTDVLRTRPDALRNFKKAWRAESVRMTVNGLAKMAISARLSTFST